MMATVPTDPNPDSPPDEPANIPDEIVPPDGDTDIPAPIDDPNTLGLAEETPAHFNYDVEGDPDRRAPIDDTNTSGLVGADAVDRAAGIEQI